MAAAIEIRSQWNRRRRTGVWPRGAQVRRTTGVSEAPLSSSKTIQACFRRACFYLGPLLPHPARDRLVVALGGPPRRLLPAPPHLAQELPHVPDVVLDSG